MEFSKRSLADLLGVERYEFEKVSSTGLGSEPDIYMAPASLRVLRRALGAFEDELKARELTTHSYLGIHGIWGETIECLERLQAYFASPGDSHLDALEAHALAKLLESH